MQKWEYFTAPIMVHATQQILNNFGEDGWELVTVLPTIENGFVLPPEGPGLGTELLPAVFDRPDLTVRRSVP